MNFENIRVKLERQKASDDLVYNTLRQASDNIDIYCPDLDKIVYNARNKVYSYMQSGRKIKASNIYECDSISAKNQCINKYHTDWDWVSKIYPRSTSELMRPRLHNGENIYLRHDFEGFTLTHVYFTHVNLGVETSQEIKVDESLDGGDYIPYLIAFDMSKVNAHQGSYGVISDSWLVAIYENKIGKSLKIVWYYSG
ncbi:hypothetical protein ACVUCS_004506 [Salmonella enterica subsp. enterica]|nr:hypothetical protein [Salmonella enterica subsp. enterica serovar Volkmarsdorf]